MDLLARVFNLALNPICGPLKRVDFVRIVRRFRVYASTLKHPSPTATKEPSQILSWCSSGGFLGLELLLWFLQEL